MKHCDFKSWGMKTVGREKLKEYYEIVDEARPLSDVNSLFLYFLIVFLYRTLRHFTQVL